jgi:hypothetical protein
MTWLFKILALATLFGHQFTFAAGLNCKDLMSLRLNESRLQLPTALKELESPSAQLDYTYAEPTNINSKYRVAAQVTTASGEVFLKVVKTGRPDVRDKKSPDGFKGDLEAIFEQYTNSFLSKLGILRNDDTFYISTAETLNARIDQINRNLPPVDQIKIRFYNARGRVDPSEYGTRFIEKLELPIAVDGSELLHDINFHFSSIFIPNLLLYQFREQLRFTIGFGRFIRKFHPELLRLPFFSHSPITAEELISKNELGLLSTRVDLFTAADNRFSYPISRDLGFSPAQFLTRSYGFDAVLKPALQFRNVLTEYLNSQRDMAKLSDLNLAFSDDKNLNEANQLYEARKKRIMEK